MVYVFGDIHGCYKTLMAFIEKYNITDDDTIIAAGDVVDRGIRIKEVLDYLLNRPKTIIVIGNHDWSFIDYFEPGGPMRNMFMMGQGLSDTITQLGGFDAAEPYAKKLKEVGKRLVRVPGDKYIICHADYNWQDGEEFSNMHHFWQRINRKTHRTYNGPIILHGHTPCPIEKAYEKKANGELFAINLDGGCCYFPHFPWATLRAFRMDDEVLLEMPNQEYT